MEAEEEQEEECKCQCEEQTVPKTPFEEKLKALEEMGFNDRRKNLELLSRFKGNVGLVVDHLLAN